MISLTDIAAKNFKRIREDEELEDSVPLRVAVKGGGCAGYEYQLDFGEPAKKDLKFESKGLPIVIDRKSHIVVDKKSHLIIDGVVIEWSTDLSSPGPRFENPRAASTCGCSTSFSIKPIEFDNTPVWMKN